MRLRPDVAPIAATYEVEPGRSRTCAAGRNSTKYNIAMTPNVDGRVGPGRLPPPPSRGEARWLTRELDKGEALYRIGDRGGTVFKVAEGLLKLTVEAASGRERIVALAGPGDVLGDLWPQGSGLGENAEALSDQTLVRSTCRSSLPPESNEELLEAATLQIARLREVLEDAELPVTARVARILLRLGRRFGQRTDDATIRLTLPLTHDHFAAMVGAARETTSSALGEIRSAGLLEGTRGRYWFEPEALERFVQQHSL